MTVRRHIRRAMELNDRQREFYAGFKAVTIRPAPIMDGSFILVTQKGHPWEGCVGKIEGVDVVMGEQMARLSLVRMDAMNGHEFYLARGGGRKATDGEVFLARGY